MKQKLLNKREYFKPFAYEWAYEAWHTQQQMHWLPTEASMADDVRQYHQTLTDSERNLINQIFRFFTQGDLDIADGYLDKLMPIFGGQPEIKMMLAAFANTETIHIAAYSHLLDTLGLPEAEYQAFKNYKSMAEKHAYLLSIVPPKDSTNLSLEEMRQIAKTLAAYSAFGEGLQLFASFAILLNFPRFGKMKGMGQIVTWSIRDEGFHVENMINLFHTFIKENPSLWTDELKKELYDICRTMVDLEDAFIDLAFEHGGIEGLTPEEVKQYIRYIADRRLLQLKLKAHYKVKENPLPWLEDMLNSTEFTNFFESTPTQYAKASTSGSWETVQW
jgi:ribonucleoside-diphosphate reductase beta chain